MTVSVTLPVLNEEKILGRSVERVLAFFEENGFRDWSLVIGDNGSTDRTGEIGEALAVAHPGRVDYRRISARGVGLAIRETWGAAEADIVGYMDADLATHLTHLNDVRRLFEEPTVRVVNGSRLMPGSQVVNRTLKREAVSRAFNLGMRRALGVRFTDTMCGFKFFRRPLAKALLEEIPAIPDWFVAAELLVRAEWAGETVHEIAVRWEDDQESKAKIVSLGKQYLGHMRRLYVEKRRRAIR